MRIVLCCGDREWEDGATIRSTLKHEHEKHPIDFVIEGGARGADNISKLVAQRLGIQVIECPANWDKFRKGAGPIRNQNQLDVAYELAGILDSKKGEVNLLVLAFHSNIKKSRGTKDMVNRAKKAGVKVKIIKGEQK
jgi:YspA, cpYpsA-related SLOG family